MPAAVIGGAVGLYGASKQAGAAKDAAKASQKATDATIAEQRRQFDLSRADQMPWLQTGQWALDGQKKALMGDYSGFMASPDYQFALDQGMKSLDRSAAASGRLYSGGYGQDLTKYAQGMATQNYQNYMNNLGRLSNTGQSTASNLGVLGQNYANAFGTAMTNNANARASSYQNQANAYTGAAFGLGNMAAGYYGSKMTPTTYPSNAMGQVMGTGWGWSPGWGG